MGKLDKNMKVCEFPWKKFKLQGCFEFEDSLYACICNRILLFRLNYKEFEGDFIKDIWNHEIIRYFRRTIMKNPICQFCRNTNTPKLRCLNNKEYQISRDKAIQEFFIGAFKNIKISPKKGIYLLNKFPYEYDGYYERI